jgi:hypothetical protein
MRQVDAALEGSNRQKMTMLERRKKQSWYVYGARWLRQGGGGGGGWERAGLGTGSSSLLPASLVSFSTCLFAGILNPPLPLPIPGIRTERSVVPSPGVTGASHDDDACIPYQTHHLQ